jgi:hypothetical protein
MGDSQVTERLTMRWVPVLDERGRTHMEARWAAEPSRQAPVQASHAA